MHRFVQCWSFERIRLKYKLVPSNIWSWTWSKVKYIFEPLRNLTACSVENTKYFFIEIFFREIISYNRCFHEIFVKKKTQLILKSNYFPWNQFTAIFKLFNNAATIFFVKSSLSKYMYLTLLVKSLIWRKNGDFP